MMLVRVESEADVGFSHAQVLTAFPFGNQIVDIQFTGQQIWDIFEGIVSGSNSAGEVSIALRDYAEDCSDICYVIQEVTSFVQVSQECTFSYNPNNAIGSRLISMRIGGADVDFARTYTISAYIDRLVRQILTHALVN